MPTPVHRARQLRRPATTPERHFWRALRIAYPAHHWRRQVAIGPYFADFAEHALRIGIEVDSGHHAGQAAADARRTELLNERGYRVLRFWATEVMGNMEGVLATLAPPPRGSALPPNPPRKGEGLDPTYALDIVPGDWIKVGLHFIQQATSNL